MSTQSPRSQVVQRHLGGTGQSPAPVSPPFSGAPWGLPGSGRSALFPVKVTSVSWGPIHFKPVPPSRAQDLPQLRQVELCHQLPSSFPRALGLGSPLCGPQPLLSILMPGQRPISKLVFSWRTGSNLGGLTTGSSEAQASGVQSASIPVPGRQAEGPLTPGAFATQFSRTSCAPGLVHLRTGCSPQARA